MAKKEERKEKGKKLEGINGWLMFFIVFFIIGVLGSLEKVISPYYWNLTSQMPFFLSFLYYFIIGSSLIISILALIYLIRSRKKWIPGFVIFSLFYSWIGAILFRLILSVSQGTPFPLKEAFATTIGTFIWIGYFTESKRVENTYSEK